VSKNFSVSVDISRAKAGLDKARPAMERNIDERLSRGAEEVARDAKGNAPKAFSNLVNTIRAERIEAMHYQVSEGMNYGRAVEEGSAPHFPNPDNLRPWVERVLGLRDKPARDAAFLIARAISRRGTRAQPYMQPAAEGKVSRLFVLVQAGVDEGLREAFA